MEKVCLALALLWVAFVGGCQGEPEFTATLHVPNPELRAIFEDCRDFWNDQLDGEEPFAVSAEPWEDNGSCADIPVRVVNLHGKYCAVAWDENECERKIQIDPRYFDIETVCHEMGHLLHLRHLDKTQKGFLMNPFHDNMKLRLTEEEKAKALHTLASYRH